MSPSPIISIGFAKTLRPSGRVPETGDVSDSRILESCELCTVAELCPTWMLGIWLKSIPYSYILKVSMKFWLSKWSMSYLMTHRIWIGGRCCFGGQAVWIRRNIFQNIAERKVMRLKLLGIRGAIVEWWPSKDIVEVWGAPQLLHLRVEILMASSCIIGIQIIHSKDWEQLRISGRRCRWRFLKILGGLQKKWQVYIPFQKCMLISVALLIGHTGKPGTPNAARLNGWKVFGS